MHACNDESRPTKVPPYITTPTPRGMLADMTKRRAAGSGAGGVKKPRREDPGSIDKVNPFELRVKKRKHHVLGQRGTRGERGMPGVSRARAIEKV